MNSINQKISRVLAIVILFNTITGNISYFNPFTGAHIDRHKKGHCIIANIIAGNTGTVYARIRDKNGNILAQDSATGNKMAMACYNINKSTRIAMYQGGANVIDIKLLDI